MTPLSKAKWITTGVVLGAVFPLMAVAAQLIYLKQPPSFNHIVELYQQGPLQWIILCAPVVLGLIFGYIHHVTSNQHHLVLVEKKKSDDLLLHLSQSIKLIEQGDLSNTNYNFNNQQLENTFRSLNSKLASQKEEDRKAKWIAEGKAKFGDILRLSTNLTDLSDVFLKNLIHYLHFNQGSIFILDKSENESGVLRLTACYAYERKKYLTKHIAIGEGVAGQCFLENETIVLKQVPQDYIKITSGLGDAKPNFVLVVPIKNYEHTEGVLEVAGFKPLENFQIQFVEEICEAFSIVIRSVKSNEETRKLLTETQTQTEQLKLQEEELRQNMEEMHATQEQLSRQLAESKLLQERVERRERVMALTTILSETDLRGVITYVNDKFCEVAKYDHAELMGKPHNIVRHPDM
ncbi:MAG TPA: hypothetical protein DGG95_07595, partial [Cytophagales bacterium]|nr:hypothetical protein [Cytophagales bacterium]